ncbi:NUDIX domain-containing protein [Streptomyces sp. p1417]|uniref:NUDIX domain-containing protein n=1 Tax=Streptomyces typhae TaxID=2681492 RepID=A0A6L6X302_9ACTN|nr:NUDIX domain-containing protein [Streptomyces typhae]
MTRAPGLVRAAGCVLWRPATAAGHIEVALVYRPKWNDWSWPKGKLDPGETPSQAAVREVEEETGMTCRLGAALPTARYTDAKGRPKEVHYWAAEATGGEFTPNDEVSHLMWLPPAAAHGQLTYSLDKALVEPFLTAVGRRRQAT